MRNWIETWRPARRSVAIGLAVLAMAAAGLAAPAGASAANRPAVPTSGASSRGEADLTPQPVLPHTTRVRADGSRVVEVDPAVVKALTAAAATTGCGSFCDGLDPNYRFTPAGGPSNWYTCAGDAITVREVYLPGGSQVKGELRYSPRCRTAWTRGGYFFYLLTNSYHTNGSFRTYTDAGRNPNVNGSDPHWTAMVNDAGLLAEACMYEDSIGELCTSRY